MEMNAVELWHQGRVLVVGDSRVRRLKSVSDPVLADNVDFYFKGGILVNDLINLVDEKITNEHHIVIIMGFIGDEVQKCCHHINEEETINLLRSNESDSSSNIIAAAKIAHERWMTQKPGRIIVWTIPYYLDYATYNTAQLGEYDFGDTITTSWDSSRRFVNYIAKLRLQWVTSNPGITFSLLNKVLFSTHSNRELYKSFGAVFGEDYCFPAQLLTDGLHPSIPLTTSIWKFLLNSVENVYLKSLPNQPVVGALRREPSINLPSTSKGLRGLKSSSYKAASQRGSKIPYKPYEKREMFKTYERTSVHSRLSRPDSSFEEPVGNFGNLSWRSSAASLSQASTSKGLSSGSLPQGQCSSWSWSYHHRVVAETKTSIFTQGVQEQKWAEGRLASIIRERGLRAASDGQLESINQASRDWVEQARVRISDPNQKSKLVQDDVQVPVDLGEEEVVELVIEPDNDDDEGIEDDSDV